ncbi:MAG: MliC family protein [Gemmatimonadota bacterium]
MTRALPSTVLMLSAGLSAPGMAAQTAPAFDCSAADGAVQALICSDPELAGLDRELQRTFDEAVAVLEGYGAARADTELPEFRTEQRGWISGRDECWKAEDVRSCTEEAYRRRIAEIQAAYRLVEPTATVHWSCQGNPANEFVTTFFATDPPAAVIERGGQTRVALQTPTASGARYEAPFGAFFWIKGREATVEWPQGTRLRCAERERLRQDVPDSF